jgi:membrane protein implicated in regulation of membrane protease activity
MKPQGSTSKSSLLYATLSKLWVIIVFCVICLLGECFGSFGTFGAMGIAAFLIAVGIHALIVRLELANEIEAAIPIVLLLVLAIILAPLLRRVHDVAEEQRGRVHASPRARVS